MQRRGLRWLLPLVACACAGTSAQASAGLEQCVERLGSRPHDYESAYCFYEVARQTGDWQRASDRLEQLSAASPENHWLTLVLAHLRWRLDPAATESTYRAAARGFSAQGHARGEVLARTNLYSFLARRGELERAGEEVEAVASIAASSDDAILTARAFVLEAEHLRDRGHDLEASYRLLRQAERWVFPGGPPRLQRQCLSLLGSVSHRLGRYDQAMRFYRRLEDLVRERGDDYAAALFAYNRANTMLAGEFELPTPGGRARLVERFRQALDAARRAGHRSAEMQGHRSLADLLSPFEQTRDLAPEHYARCTELARASRRPQRTAACLASHASHLARWGDSDAAAMMLDEALALAHEAADAEVAVRVHEERMLASWARGDRRASLQASRQALDALEALRDGQQASSGRADLLAAWSDLYYWPAGRLLDGEPSRDDIELAFGFIERLRARVLLEKAASSRAGDFERDEGAWAPVLAELVRVQRRLLEPALGDADRRRALRQLERAEMNEAEVWRHLPGAAIDGDVSFAALGAVEAALAPNEALLSFQVALWQDVYGDFAGGSWLLVSTRSGTRPYRLPDRAALRPAIRLFNGLVEGRDEAVSAAAARLYRALLQEALDELPPGIERLMIVPDGDLHRLPFAALRADPRAPVLARRFHLSRLPSATLWLRWRARRNRSSSRSVLALADPTPSSGAEAVSAQRNWALASGGRLGALPYARREGRRIVERLDGHLLVGADATERFIKSERLEDFGVVHFAAHAVIDAEHPQRSAVLLAPGGPAEDGLLQPRDIARLDLGGKIVVLAACQGAAGAVLRGEGVLSLARSFFAAGSSAVVGSLWRLRDDEAAELFDRFYGHLSKGRSVEAALAGAQADLIRAGAPAAAWAGLSVLGDGSVMPFPHAPAATGTPWLPIAGGALLAVLILLAWRRVSRRA